MGRYKINEEDKVVSMIVMTKGYILDNINNDPAAMNEIQAFIEEKWGIKDVEKYDEERRRKRIDWLEHNLKINSSRLKELKTKHGEKSDIYKMMSPAIIKRIAEYEQERLLIKE